MEQISVNNTFFKKFNQIKRKNKQFLNTCMSLKKIIYNY